MRTSSEHGRTGRGRARLPVVLAVLAVLGSGGASAAQRPAPVPERWVLVGEPGNAPDTEVMGDGTTGLGAVAHRYEIAATEVTNAQYAAFLDAKAAVADPLGLYHPFMDKAEGLGQGSGIVRSGLPGSYRYTVPEGLEDRPVNYVSFFDALRYANWRHHGGGDGDTETGAYALLGPAPVPANAADVQRERGARYAVPTEDEWYKAAYWSPAGDRYYDYPTGSDHETVCSGPTRTRDTANCGNAAGDEGRDLGVPPGTPFLSAVGEAVKGGAFTDAGAYPRSASPLGTYDQGGGVFEWNETVADTPAGPPFVDTGLPALPRERVLYRSIRGGSYADPAYHLHAAHRNALTPDSEFAALGFRLVRL